MDVLDMIETRRYSIHSSLAPEYRETVLNARQQLRERGSAELPGFLTPSAVQLFTEDATYVSNRAYRSEGMGTPYLETPDDGQWPASHPRRLQSRSRVSAVGYDLIPLTSPLRLLYEDEDVRRFLEAILDVPVLFRYADPFGALNLSVMDEDDELGWHFDQTDFVVSLAIQSAEQGGDFEVVPNIRSARDERYDDVQRLLNGDEIEVVTLPMVPGTLLIFRGRHSIHRVTPVSGHTPRLVGLLGFDTSEGTMSSRELRIDRYGRSDAFGEPPIEWPSP